MLPAPAASIRPSRSRCRRSSTSSPCTGVSCRWGTSRAVRNWGRRLGKNCVWRAWQVHAAAARLRAHFVAAGWYRSRQTGLLPAPALRIRPSPASGAAYGLPPRSAGRVAGDPPRPRPVWVCPCLCFVSGAREVHRAPCVFNHYCVCRWRTTTIHSCVPCGVYTIHSPTRVKAFWENPWRPSPRSRPRWA